MKMNVVIGFGCCMLAAVAWAKGPKMPVARQPAAAKYKAPAATVHAQQAQQKAAVHSMQMRQQNAAKAAIAQQHAREKAMQTRQHIAEKQIRATARHMPPPTFRYGAPPPHLHGWRRGPTPHPTWRSGWYGDVWYDAYGYPYYSPTVVAQPVVYQTAPAVVTPAQPVVVTPAPTVVTPATTVVTPAQPVVVTPQPTVVY